MSASKPASPSICDSANTAASRTSRSTRSSAVRSSRSPATSSPAISPSQKVASSRVSVGISASRAISRSSGQTTTPRASVAGKIASSPASPRSARARSRRSRAAAAGSSVPRSDASDLGTQRPPTNVSRSVARPPRTSIATRTGPGSQSDDHSGWPRNEWSPSPVQMLPRPLPHTPSRAANDIRITPSPIPLARSASDCARAPSAPQPSVTAARQSARCDAAVREIARRALTG